MNYFLKLYGNLFANKAFKNVATLTVFTFVNQFVGFLFLPMLTRLYNPSEFGTFYTFTSIAQILGLASTLKYEKSIILPDKEEHSESLIALTILIIVSYSFAIFFISIILSLLGTLSNVINTYILLLIPITVLTYALQNTILLWHQRKERFKLIAIVNVAQSIIVVTTSSVLGVLNINRFGLVIGYILGSLLCVLYLISRDTSKLYSIISNVSPHSLLNNFKRYIDFPKYYLLYDLFSVGTLYLVPIIISTFYSEEICGFYSIVYKVLMVPIVSIAYAVYNVFLVEAQKEYNHAGRFDNIYKKTLIRLSILSFIIYFLFFIQGNNILSLLLGHEWSDIDIYIKPLSIMLFFEFITFVFRSNTYIITQKQKTGMYIQVLSTVFSLFMLVSLYKYGIEKSLWTFVLITVCFNCLTLFITYKYSKGLPLRTPAC